MQPVTIEADAERGVILVDCDFRDRDSMQDIPGKRWKQEERLWHTPLSWAAMLQLRGVFQERLQVGPKLHDLAQQVRERRIEPSLALRVAPDAQIDVGRARDLVPLQRSAVAFAVTALHALIADPMGSGKTPVTLTALLWLREHGMEPFPALVVCPTGVKRHWQNEAAAWAPDVSVTVVEGSAKKRREQLNDGADIHVINWELLAKHSRLAPYGSTPLTDKEKEPKELNLLPAEDGAKPEKRVYRTVIADEAHRGKDPKAKQTRALWAVSDLAAYRYALTGTPVANTPEDLWAVMRFVSPIEYPARTAFNDRYAMLSWNAFGGLNVVGLKGETRDELFGFLDPRMIRRPKEVILPSLREKLPPQVRLASMPHKQRKQYVQLRDEMLAELEDGTLMASNPLKKMLRLRQLAGATGKLVEEGGKQTVDLVEPSGKLDEMMEVLGELDLATEKVTVFSESRKLLDLASERLRKNDVTHQVIAGGVSNDDRESARQMFQDRRSGMNVLLLSIGAGAEGLDLSQTDVQIFLERSWSAFKNLQADERGHRPGGAETPLRIVDIVAVDTVDAVVHSRYADKLDRLEEVVRDEETLKQWLGT